MRIRIVSASVGIPVVLVAIWLGLPGVAVLAVAAGLIAGLELDRMMRAAAQGKSWPGNIRIISLVAGPPALSSVAAWMVSTGRISGDQFPIVLAVIFALVLLLRGLATIGRLRPDRSGADWVYWVFAAYVGIALAHAPVIIEIDHGRELVGVAISGGRELIFLAIFTTFAIDSSALLVGSSIGRTRLAPSISPKKSWEGAIGGVLAGAIVAVAIDAVFDIQFSTVTAGILGAVLGVTAVFGDLFESWIKRRAEVKDSGTLIPGHGGVLDRLDSVIPNIVIVYWAAVWFAT